MYTQNKSYTGRRKSAQAQVRLVSRAPGSQGNGQLLINNLDAVQSQSYLQGMSFSALKPLQVLGLEEKFDVSVQVKGGGLSSQADAIRLGVSRALLEDTENSYRSVLKSEGFLTRNSLIKERKKYGLKKARKAPQFSKR